MHRRLPLLMPVSEATAPKRPGSSNQCHPARASPAHCNPTATRPKSSNPHHPSNATGAHLHRKDRQARVPAAQERSAAGGGGKGAAPRSNAGLLLRSGRLLRLRVCACCRDLNSPALDSPLPPPSSRLCQLSETEQRVEIGLHYGIPYPRLHHTPEQFKRRTYMALPQMPAAVGGKPRDGK
jgi:hypothetical protein